MRMHNAHVAYRATLPIPALLVPYPIQTTFSPEDIPFIYHRFFPRIHREMSHFNPKKPANTRRG